MKETKEFTGKDVDAAVTQACSALGVSKKDLKYEVLVAGTSGIFGIVGRKDAKIRVTLPTPRKSQTSDEDMEGIRSMVDEAFGRETRREEAAEAARPEGRGAKDTNAPDDTGGEDAGRWGSTPAPRDTRGPRTQVPEAEAPEESDPPEQAEAPEAPETPKPSEPSEEDPEADESPDADEEAPEPEGPPPVPVSQESVDLGLEALQKMADLITDDAKIEARTEDDHLTLQITGGNAGILIGRKGQTLDAMQFLTDKIINRQSEDRVRVKVDIEGYMETRKANLRQLAFKMAEKAKKTGRPATINQMSAQDRRIVHLALKDDTQVRTQSMGDGYYRRLVIFPKKRNAYRGKRRSKRNDR